MAICEGPITGIVQAWDDKDNANAATLTALGFLTFLGTLSQAAWSFLTTNYPAEAVPYELTAYMAHPKWPLPNNALANYSWEVQALLQWGGGIVDANPKDVINDFLTDANHGLGMSSSLIASLTTFRDYCTAAGIFLSPVFDTQRPASEILQELLACSNSEIVWSDGQIKIVPYGDQNLSGNSATFTANTTPIYNLTDDDFIAADGEDPVHCTRRAQSDVYNMVQVEFDNRSNQYNGDVAEAKDQNSIELYGLKPAEVIKAPFVKLATVARLLGQLALQRQVYIRNEHAFTLPMRYALLEPMDFVTLTDSILGLNQTLVRIKEINENDDETFNVVAEEWTLGVGTAPAYGSTSTGGAPTPTGWEKSPAMPGITTSFDSSGQLILNLTGDSRTVRHIYNVRTDRLPTIPETRAGTAVAFAGQANIATGITVLAGQTVYIGDLAYNSIGGESAQSTAVIKRQGSGTSAPPVPKITPLNTEPDDTVWDFSFDADAGSGGGGTNLTYTLRTKYGVASETSLSTGNATAFPLILSVARDLRHSKSLRFRLTDVATGLIAEKDWPIPSQRSEIDGTARFKRVNPFTDGQYAYRATETDGSTKTSAAHNPQGSFLPASMLVNPFSYAAGGLATNRMWVAFTWNAFTLFRPDGTSLSVVASSALATAPLPIWNQVSGGPAGARTLYARIAYIKNNVITGISAEAGPLSISAGNALQIFSPAAVTGYDKWVPLVGSAANGEYIQPELPFGTDYVEAASGFNSTTTTQFNTSMLNAAVMPALPASTTLYWYPFYDVGLGFIAFASRGATAKSEVDAQTQNGDGKMPLSFGGMSLATPAGGGSTSGTPANGGGRNL
jgi:hypothetical protein